MHWDRPRSCDTLSVSDSEAPHSMDDDPTLVPLPEPSPEDRRTRTFHSGAPKRPVGAAGDSRRAGQRIGPYELIEKLGEGGMG